MRRASVLNTEVDPLAYGAAALPLAAIGVTFHVYLPKLLVDVGVFSATFIGTIFLTSRIWDAVLDPLMGYLTDRFSVFGFRRKVWFLAGLPLGLCGAMIVTSTNQLHFALLAFLFFFLWTVVVVPYEALGAEWDLSSSERLKVFSFREGALIIGTLLAAAVPVLYENMSERRFNVDAAEYIMFVYAAVLVLTLIWCSITVREPVRALCKRESFKDSLSLCAGNQPFRWLTISSALHSLAAALPAVLVLFFVETVLQSENGSLFLCFYFLSGVVFLPIWNHLGKSNEQLRLLKIAMLIQGISFFLVTFLPPGAELSFGLLVTLSGIGYGGVLALYSSLLVACVDYEERSTGDRREGSFVGIWSIVKKGAIAIGSGLALVGLGLSGHVAGSVEQSDSVVMTLRVLYAGFPLVLILAALLMLSNFKIPSTLGALDV